MICAECKIAVTQSYILTRVKANTFGIWAEGKEYFYFQTVIDSEITGHFSAWMCILLQNYTLFNVHWCSFMEI